jgi:uncharacterized protein (DUF302 family)/predicted alpha/beta hydrolase
MSAGAPVPWRTVDDEDGLWSFRVYGEEDADTVLVLLSALGVPARYYAPLVRGWVKENVAVVQADFLVGRVRSGAAGDGRDGFAVLVEWCVPAIFAAVRGSLPRAAPVIVGHSLGGQLGLIAAARFTPDLPVVLAASGSVGHRGFPGWRRWTGLASSQVIRLVCRVLGYWPGDRLGFGGRQPAAVMRDWAYTVRTGRYRAATGSFDYETALREYRGDVLAISVDQDVFAPRTATKALLAKAPNARVTHRNYAASRGTARPGAHFTWVKDQPGLAGIIAQWARSRPPPAAGVLDEKGDGLITVQSRFTVSQTIDRLAAAAVAAGLLVFARIDHGKGALDAGLQLRPTELLIFGHPRGGTPLMSESQQVGIDLPFKALAWEDEEGRVWLTWNDAQWLARRHRLSAATASAAEAIRTGASELAATAAGLNPPP